MFPRAADFLSTNNNNNNSHFPLFASSVRRFFVRLDGFDEAEEIWQGGRCLELWSFSAEGLASWTVSSFPFGIGGGEWVFADAVLLLFGRGLEVLCRFVWLLFSLALHNNFRTVDNLTYFLVCFFTQI